MDNDASKHTIRDLYGDPNGLARIEPDDNTSVWFNITHPVYYVNLASRDISKRRKRRLRGKRKESK